MRQRRRKQQTKSAYAGSSMVEVLVAVLVVMIMMAVLSTAMSTALDMWNRSSNRLQEIMLLDQEYYKNHAEDDPRVDTKDVTFTLQLMDKGEPSGTKIGVEGVYLETFRIPEGARCRLRMKED